MQEFVATDSDLGLRADVFIAAQYPGFSRSALERLFDQGLIRVNQKVAKASQRLKPSDMIIVDEQLIRAEPAGIKLPILYEDKDVIVIDKPAGVLTHSKGALNTEATVASFIKNKINDPCLQGNRAGIVHRLDRATSGIIITAKNEPALKWLQKQFSSRNVNKNYIAIIEGHLEQPEAIIDAPIARNPRKPQTFIVSPLGKKAVTRYKLKKEIANFTEVELFPETGRTHQLRVHMAYINHPIVGDSVYGHEGNALLLHALSLEITLPNKERKVFTAQLPLRFKEFESSAR